MKNKAREENRKRRIRQEEFCKKRDRIAKEDERRKAKTYSLQIPLGGSMTF
jgi:hypothetical protein